MPNLVPEGEGLKNVELAGQRKLGNENEEELQQMNGQLVTLLNVDKTPGLTM